MNRQLRPKFISDFTIQKFDDNHVLIDREKPVWVAVNQLGLDVLKLCNGQNTVSDIAATLSKRYNVVYETVYKDTFQFIQSFQDMKPIQNDKASNSNSDSIYIELTRRCNLNCIHCCLDKNKPVEDKFQLNEYLRVIEEYYSLPTHSKNIILFGGEPLLNRNWLEIAIFAKDLGFEVSILTNGTLITREIAEKLASTNIRVQVSLDGSSKKTHDFIRGNGAFEATMRGITNLTQVGINGDYLWLSFTPMKINLHEIKDFVELSVSMGVYCLHLPALISLGNAKRNLSTVSYSLEEKIQFDESLEEAKRQYPFLRFSKIISDTTLRILRGDMRLLMCSCQAPLYIDVEGNIFWCVNALSDEYCLGNIETSRLAEIPNQNKYQNILSQFEQRIKKIKSQQPCTSCKWNAFCPPPCPMRALAGYGTMMSVDGHCEQFKYWFNKNLERLVREKYRGSFTTVFDYSHPHNPIRVATKSM